MEDYEYYYSYYRGKYYDACSEVDSCDRQINSLQQQRNDHTKANTSLSAKIRKTERALELLEDILKRENPINTKLAAVNTKTQQAAVNYSGMVSSSDVSNKDLNEVYGQELSSTKTTISGVFETVRTRKTNLSTELSDLQAELQRRKQAIEDIDRQLRSLRSDRGYWKKKKTSHYYNMEYYRKKMLAAG